MTDFIDGLGRDLIEAAQRIDEIEASAAQRGRRPTRRPPWRLVGAAAAALLIAGGSATAATLLALRGTIIPSPRAVPPEQTPEPGSTHVARFSVADPSRGQLRWTLRVARSHTGYVCSTVGELDGGRFGLIGTDGHFRSLAAGVADSCGVAQADGVTLIGARTLAAVGRGRPLTVLSGVGGPRLRHVTVTVAGRRRQVAVHAEGTFLSVLRGFPEDLGIVARLRYADGHVERRAFGFAPTVVADPAGGRAWRTRLVTSAGGQRACVTFVPAREIVRAPSSPPACGRLGDDVRRPHGFFFAVRRLTPGSGRRRPGVLPGSLGWLDHPPRTAVWGAYGTDVAGVRVTGPPGAVSTSTSKSPGGAFLTLFGPGVRPDQLRIVVRYKDGRTLTRVGDTNLAGVRTMSRRSPGKATP